MRRSGRWALAMAMAMAGGCGGAAPEAQEPMAQPHGEGAPVTGHSTSQQHLGEWVMAPPPGQEREVALVRYALATPPAVEAFEATSPLPDEQEFFSNILRTRREDPGSPILVSLQRKLDALEAVRVTFLPEKFIVTTETGTDIIAYRVEEDLGHQLVILEDGAAPESSRRTILSFDGGDRMVMTTSGMRVPMVRVPDGTLPRPNEVARAPEGTTGGVPAGAGSASGGSVPASGNAEYDTCVSEYYRCIDQMSASDREAMAETLTHTKRIFTEAQGDPGRMREALESCKQAVSLAKMTFCR